MHKFVLRYFHYIIYINQLLWIFQHLSSTELSIAVKKKAMFIIGSISLFCVMAYFGKKIRFTLNADD